MTEEAFEQLSAINALGWRWGEQSLDDYLGQGWHFEKSSEMLHINARRPMHNHRRLMGILAWFKSGQGTDRLEQHGAVQDAWFDKGRYFVQQGRWGYVGRGTMVVGPESVVNGPEDPDEADVVAWMPAIPPIKGVRISASSIQLELIDGIEVEAPIERLYDLAMLNANQRASYEVFTDRLEFRCERGQVVTINAEDVWQARDLSVE